MIKLFPIPAFHDNYIWAIINTDNNKVVVVDPGSDTAVFAALAKNNWQLSGILITHHHWDHTGGIEKLVEKYPVPVYGPDNKKISSITHKLIENDKVFQNDLNICFTTLEVPGHTQDHIAYYSPQILLCGDTLFTGGCGKIFEGTAKEMYQSLMKLAQLPDDTAVYCAHEYTLNNLIFAKTVEPENEVLIQRLQKTQQQRKLLQCTVPSTLLLEKQTNPFLRCHLDTVWKSAEQHSSKSLSSPSDVLAVIRKWKDKFNI